MALHPRSGLQYFERALVHPERDQVEAPSGSVLALTEQALPALASEMLGGSLEMARVLGLRTGELHVALASDRTDPAFAPEPFGAHYQRSIYQSMGNLVTGSFALLRSRLRALLLEKASYELAYELNHRPDWVSIPIRGLLSLVASED